MSSKSPFYINAGNKTFTLYQNSNKLAQNSAYLNAYKNKLDQFNSAFNNYASTGSKNSVTIDGKNYPYENNVDWDVVEQYSNNYSISRSANGMKKTVNFYKDANGNSKKHIKITNNNANDLTSISAVFQNETTDASSKIKTQQLGFRNKGEDKIFSTKSFDTNTKNLVFEGYDSNLDGINEEENYYRADGTKLKSVVDIDSDKNPELVIDYGYFNEMTSFFIDNNSNGTGKSYMVYDDEVVLIEDNRKFSEKIKDFFTGKD